MLATVEPQLPRRVRRTFGAPEGLRALAALCFCVAAGALTLPPRSILLAPATEPAVGPGAQALLVAAGGLLGLWFLIDAARRASLPAPTGSPTGRRVRWALVTVAAGLAVLALQLLKPLADAGRLSDLSGAFVMLWIAGVGVTLIIVGLGALRRRRQYAHTGCLPRADGPSTRALAAWSHPTEPLLRPPGRPGPALSPIALDAAALPPRSSASGYSFRTLIQAVQPLVSVGSFLRPTSRRHARGRRERPSLLVLAPLLLALLPMAFFLAKFLQFLVRLVFGPRAA